MRIISVVILLVIVFASLGYSKNENKEKRVFVNSAYQQLIEKLRQKESESLSELAQKQKEINEKKERFEKILVEMKGVEEYNLSKYSEKLEVLKKEARIKLEDEINQYNTLEQKVKQRKIEITNQKQELEKYLNAWLKDGSPGKFASLTENITKIAIQYNVTANVRWITIPKSGALIYYQTIFQRDHGDKPLSLNNTSVTNEEIPIGYYYIWSVRNGKPTSDMTRTFLITEKTSQVTIVEVSRRQGE